MQYFMINSTSNSKDYIHLVATSLELGCLTTHNSITNNTTVKNHPNKIEMKWDKDITLENSIV